MRNNLRAGVIGVGTFGSLHAGIYAEDKSTELVAVADIQPERAERKRGNGTFDPCRNRISRVPKCRSRLWESS